MKQVLLALLGLWLVHCPYLHAEDATDIPASVLAVWEEQWLAATEELITSATKAYAEDAFPGEDPARVQAFVADFEALLRQRLSWELFGREQTERILHDVCGVELLREAVPYYAGEVQFEELSDGLQEELLRCWGDARLYVGATPAYELMAIGDEEIAALLQRHGIRSGKNED